VRCDTEAAPVLCGVNPDSEFLLLPIVEGGFQGDPKVLGLVRKPCQNESEGCNVPERDRDLDLVTAGPGDRCGLRIP
jgi:hypothetical protein